MLNGIRLGLIVWVVLLLAIYEARGQSYQPLKPQPLSITTIANAGTSQVVLTPAQHLNGGYIQNCPSNSNSVVLWVNDQGAATETTGASNVQLNLGWTYPVPSGNSTISITGNTSGASVCGEGYN